MEQMNGQLKAPLLPSTPVGRAIRVTNHPTGFVCSDLCVYVCVRQSAEIVNK